MFVAVAALMGCGDSATEVEELIRPADVAGTYILQTVDGQTLSGRVGTEVVALSLETTLNADGTCSKTATRQETAQTLRIPHLEVT